MLLLLLTPNKILKKTENRVLLSVPEWGPSTSGKDQKVGVERTQTSARQS